MLIVTPWKEGQRHGWAIMLRQIEQICIVPTIFPAVTQRINASAHPYPAQDTYSCRVRMSLCMYASQPTITRLLKISLSNPRKLDLRLQNFSICKRTCADHCSHLKDAVLASKACWKLPVHDVGLRPLVTGILNCLVRDVPLFHTMLHPAKFLSSDHDMLAYRQRNSKFLGVIFRD